MDISEFAAKNYYFPNWDLIGKKVNLSGYLPLFTSSSPATTQSCYLVYKIFLPKKKYVDLSLSLSLVKSQDYGDVVNDCIGVKTNNGKYLIQPLWGCSKCWLFWQNKTWEKMTVHTEPCTSLQFKAGYPTCQTYLWASAGLSWCWPIEPLIEKDCVCKIKYFKPRNWILSSRLENTKDLGIDFWQFFRNSDVHVFPGKLLELRSDV